jgi:hypothetical protein
MFSLQDTSIVQRAQPASLHQVIGAAAISSKRARAGPAKPNFASGDAKCSAFSLAGSCDSGVAMSSCKHSKDGLDAYGCYVVEILSAVGAHVVCMVEQMDMTHSTLEGIRTSHPSNSGP